MALFNDKKDVPTKGENTVSARAEGTHTILGEGTEFEGKLAFEGQVHIEGKFSGQITTKDELVIGAKAKVTAEISGGTITIHGNVEGNVKASNTIVLKSTSRVKGSLETASLTVDKGAILEGSCKMENLGKGGTPPTPGAVLK